MSAPYYIFYNLSHIFIFLHVSYEFKEFVIHILFYVNICMVLSCQLIAVVSYLQCQATLTLFILVYSDRPFLKSFCHYSETVIKGSLLVQRERRKRYFKEGSLYIHRYHPLICPIRESQPPIFFFSFLCQTSQTGAFFVFLGLLKGSPL